MQSEEDLELSHEIIARLKLNFDGRQLFVRIPAEMQRYFNLKKGEEFEFFVDTRTDKKDYHKFRIIQKDKNGK
ncbi:MAG: AbrB/MazE/SpoVT family DNA-binding domain-containing protein [Candidatus Helarchaeota archaeon]